MDHLGSAAPDQAAVHAIPTLAPSATRRQNVDDGNEGLRQAIERMGAHDVARLSAQVGVPVYKPREEEPGSDA